MTVAVATVAFTAALVAEATGGRLAAGSPDAVFAGVSIDSRTTAAGALFVAIQGDRFDGHEFVAKALSQGASGLMVSQPVEAPPGAVVVAVPDTLLACRIWRGKSGAVAHDRGCDYRQRRKDIHEGTDGRLARHAVLAFSATRATSTTTSGYRSRSPSSRLAMTWRSWNLG